jgi:hypothetical protein
MLKIIYIFYVAIVSVALLYSSAKAEVEMIEDSFESFSLKISLSSDMTGVIKGKTCDLCEMQTLAVTPETKAYQNNVEVPISQAKKRFGKPALVLFDIKTKKVNTIIW